MNGITDFLFARPSFLEGMGRVVDLGDTLTEYNSSADSDQVALAMDWVAVGGFLEQAMTEYQNSTQIEAVGAMPRVEEK